MKDSLETLLGRPLDQPTVLMLAAGSAAAAYLGFLLIRSMWGAARPVTTDDDLEPVSLLDDLRQRSAKKSLPQRLDAAFESLVRETGLGLSTEQSLAWILLAGVFGAAAFYIARPEPILAIVGLLLGIGLTLLVLGHYQSQQRWKIREQLPEVFFLLARSMRAGLSVEQSIALLAQEKKLLLAGEFRRCAKRMELGMPADAALDLMAKRLRILDFDGLVALVAVNQSTGGNMPMLLERLATGTREHNQFRNYVRTATALGRASALCIGLATPVVLLGYAIVQPEFCLAFFRSTFGWTMVAAALALDIVGGVWLFFLLRIEY